MAPNIDKAYQWAINTCNAPNVGYSMANRYQETINGITYYDCSSFIWYALQAGDFPLTGWAFTTRNMIGALLSIGFVEHPINSPWMPGDVLWRSGHTEMVYEPTSNGGYTMGAHGDRSDGFDLPDQVCIYTNPTQYTSWTRLFRYGNGATGGYGSNLSVIAAICANFYRASHLNPAWWEGGTVERWTDTGKGYGLGQWENEASAPTDGYKPPFKWLYDTYVNTTSGNLLPAPSHRYAVTEIIQCGPGDIVKNNTPNYIPSGVYLSQTIIYYKTVSTLNDTYAGSAVSLNNLATVTVPANITGYRIQYSRTTASGAILVSPECEDYADITHRPKNRLISLHDWLIANNYAVDSGDGQVNYFLTEAYWKTTGTGAAWAADFPTLKDFLSDTTETLDTLTEIFFNCWRGLSSTAAAAELNFTKTAAVAILAYLLQHYNAEAQWTASAAGITDAEAFDNSVMIFRLLSAGIGGGGGIYPDYEVLKVPRFLYMRTRRPITIST